MNMLDLPGLLETLGYTDGEHVQICQAAPGGQFSATIHPYTSAWSEPDQNVNLWFSVNPTDPDADRGKGQRGGEADVLRLSSVFADLDVKPGGCPDFETAKDIIADLSGILGTRPSAVTYSGNGLQPFWPIEDGRIVAQPTMHPEATITTGDARSLLRRWGRLVAHIAAMHSSQVDSVYDLPRILRIPNSQNWKDPAAPKPVVTFADTGGPITVEQLADALTAHGVVETAEDRRDTGEIVMPPEEWEYGSKTCSYAANAIKGWAADMPTARHPWLTSQATRLAAMHRAGCITGEAHIEAVKALKTRFLWLLSNTHPVRPEAVGEITGALFWGQARAASMDDPKREELGAHIHIDEGWLPGGGKGAQEVSPPRTPLTLVPDTPGPAPADTPRSDTPPPISSGSSALAPQPAAARLSMRYSEDGHALALAESYGDLVRYNADRGTWYSWTGYRWLQEPPSGGTVREYAKHIARDVPLTQDTKAENWKRRSLGAAGVTGVLLQASSIPELVIRTPDLDADPYQLNTPGGLVDLRTATIRPAEPADLVSRTTNVAPDFEHPPRLWEDFLNTTFGGDADLIAYMQRTAGLALIGETRERILPFWYGSGANGKSTLLDLLQWIMRVGEGGYAISAPSEMLMVRKHEAHSTEIAQLAGARLVVCSELEDGQRIAAARMKLLTGNDMLSGRFLYGQPFTFTPSHLLVLAGNHRPDATADDQALWDRLKCVPFAHTVPTGQRDPDLAAKLRDIGGYVLGWAIQGAADYLAHGLPTPDAVRSATQDYRADQDSVGRFVEEQAILADSTAARTSVSDLRNAYDSYCAEGGLVAVNPKRLAQELMRRWPIKSVKGARGVRYYQGIMLAADEAPDEF